jgi:hypothetical protein
MKIAIIHDKKQYNLSPGLYGIDGEYLFEFTPAGILNIVPLSECQILIYS